MRQSADVQKQETPGGSETPASTLVATERVGGQLWAYHRVKVDEKFIDGVARSRDYLNPRSLQRFLPLWVRRIQARHLLRTRFGADG